jgi:aminoglycoside 2'-N-acetyltransferase I
MVTGALERVVRGAYDLHALGATDEAANFYTGPEKMARNSALTPKGITRTEEG